MGTTLVLGATPNPERYAYRAARALAGAGEPFLLVGIKQGTVAGQPIETEFPPVGTVETVTLYVGPQHQAAYADAIISLQPKRVIFNPGTENATFQAALRAAGIQVVEACTLVLLSTGQYHRVLAD